MTFERVLFCLSLSNPGCYAYCSIYVTIVHPSFRINLAGRRKEKERERVRGSEGGREVEREGREEREEGR